MFRLNSSLNVFLVVTTIMYVIFLLFIKRVLTCGGPESTHSGARTLLLSANGAATIEGLAGRRWNTICLYVIEQAYRCNRYDREPELTSVWLLSERNLLGPDMPIALIAPTARSAKHPLNIRTPRERDSQVYNSVTHGVEIDAAPM